MTRKNSRIRRIRLTAFALLFAAALTTLASCTRIGSAEVEKTAKVVPITNQFRTVYLEVPNGYNADTPYYINGQIYIRYYADDVRKEDKLYIYDKSGNTVEKKELVVSGYYSNSTLVLSEDDTYFTVDIKSLTKAKFDGTVIFETDILDSFEFTPSPLLFDKTTALVYDDEYIYVLFSYRGAASIGQTVEHKLSLLVFTIDGEPVKKIDFDELTGELYISPDGGVVFYGYESTVNKFLRNRIYYTIDTDTWQAVPSEMPELPDGASASDVYNDISFSDAYTTYYKDSHGLFGYNSGMMPELFVNWTNSAIIGDNCEVVSVIDTDTVLCMLGESDSQSAHIALRNTTTKPVLLLRVSDEEAQSKTVLTLATTRSSSKMLDIIYRFNRTSDKYYIVVDDYSLNLSGEENTAEERFDLDLAKGLVHDLHYIGGTIERDKYLKLGLFTDLYEFLDNDDTFSRESILGSIRGYGEYNGQLRYLPINFQMHTTAAKTSIFGDGNALTISDLIEVRNNMSSQNRLFLSCGRDQVFKYTLYSFIGDCIDYENESCDFNNDSFIEMLEFIKTLPVDAGIRRGDYYITDSAKEEEIAAIRGEAAYLFELGLLDASSFVRLKYIFGDEDYTIKGYPSNNKNGSILSVSGFFGINANSENKDGAWEFMKFLLNDETQLYNGALPITYSAFEKAIYEYVDMDIYENLKMPSTGTMSFGEDISNYAEGTYKKFDFTEEDAEKAIAFMNDTAVTPSLDVTTYEIIMEEVDAYFADDITVEKCAEYIQNRVSIYISEQYG